MRAWSKSGLNIGTMVLLFALSGSAYSSTCNLFYERSILSGTRVNDGNYFATLYVSEGLHHLALQSTFFGHHIKIAREIYVEGVPQEILWMGQIRFEEGRAVVVLDSPGIRENDLNSLKDLEWNVRPEIAREIFGKDSEFARARFVEPSGELTFLDPHMQRVFEIQSATTRPHEVEYGFYQQASMIAGLAIAINRLMTVGKPEEFLEKILDNDVVRVQLDQASALAAYRLSQVEMEPARARRLEQVVVQIENLLRTGLEGADLQHLHLGLQELMRTPSDSVLILYVHREAN